MLLSHLSENSLDSGLTLWEQPIIRALLKKQKVCSNCFTSLLPEAVISVGTNNWGFSWPQGF